MCFTPVISLSTAIIEFFVATFLLFYYSKSNFRKITIFLYLLGAYQFTEFMLCTSNDLIWAKLGFVAYTFLPAVALSFCLVYVKKNSRNLLVFALPVFFSLFALLKPDFVTDATCGTYFILVKQLFYQTIYFVPSIIYFTYYFGFIAMTSYLLIQHYMNAKNSISKKIDLIVLFGIFVSLIPAIILLFIFPSLSMMFPSIYCQFAIIFTVCAMLVFYLENKYLFQLKF